MVDVFFWCIFHYHLIKKNLDANLLFTDTDSLIYEIKSKDDVFEEWNTCLTLVNINRNSLIQLTKKILAKMKVEYKGVSINEFIGLKSKMYAILAENHKKFSKAKWVNISIDFSEYKDILFKKKIIRHKMKKIQSKKHKLGTYEINKISLSGFEDKRFVLDDVIHTIAYFPKDLKEQKDVQKDSHRKEKIQKDSHK